jgi:hypothetical protein
LAACALFHCDADDEKKLGLLRDAGLHIIDISGIACEDWDILKLAVAVKVICCPKEELTDFHEVNNTSLLSLHFMEACISGAKSCSSQVLAEDVVSQVLVLCCVWTFVVAPWVRESFGSCSLSAARFCNLAVDGSDYRRGRNLVP